MKMPVTVGISVAACLVSFFVLVGDESGKLVGAAASSTPTSAATSTQASKPTIEERVLGWKLRHIEFNGTSLSDALDYVHEASMVGGAIDWPSLQAIGVSKDVSIKLKMKEGTLRDVLKGIFDNIPQANNPDNPVVYVAPQGALVITTLERLKAELASTRPTDMTHYLRPRVMVLTKPSLSSAPTSAWATTQAGGLSAEERVLGWKLENIDFDNIHLADALIRIHEASSLRVVIDWPSLDAAGVLQEKLVRLKMKSGTLREVLKGVFDGIPEACKEDNPVIYMAPAGVLIITTRHGLALAMDTKGWSELRFELESLERLRPNSTMPAEK